MNLDLLRRLQSKLFAAAFVAAAALSLTSCGGGGASGSPNVAGPVALQPGTASLYAGVPYTINIVGGRKPYLVTSSEMTLINLNETIDGYSFSFVPNNPGVIDADLEEGEVPSRTVNLTVRDSLGSSSVHEFSVLQNFVTGYSAGFASTCAAPTSGAAPDACSGTDTILLLYPISNGVLFGNREFQLDKVRGDFQFVPEPPGVNPQLTDRLRVRTDHQGGAFARIRVAINAPTQIASFKVTDIPTGATSEFLFVIVQQAPAGAITVLPGGPVSFTGTNGQCGFGSSDQFVYDGTPPYTITAPGGTTISVSPATLTAGGQRFTIFVGQGAPVTNCPNGSIIITDAQGRVAQVQVTSTVGGSAPDIQVGPVPIDLRNACSVAVSAAVIGGSGPLQVVSNHSRVIAIISGGILTVSRVSSGDGATVYPTSAILAVTDGTKIVNVTVSNVAPNCP